MPGARDSGDPTEATRTRSRKEEHVDIILRDDVRARANAWDDVHLVHEALPEVDFDAIDLRSTFLGVGLGAPVMIASMTGGYPDAERINANLARAAAEHRLPMGVGSQRAALLSPESKKTFAVVRDYDVPFLAANVGAPQLIPQGRRPALTRAQLGDLVSMLEADALIVHLNFLQEVVQPEGDLRAEGCEAALRDLIADLGVPVIVKETGAGVSRSSAVRLSACGAAALDVGGLSGTTFAAVEMVRARREGAASQSRLGEVFRDWGIPTPVAVLEALPVGLPIIATGGHRSGLDCARALALGASVAGVASAGLRAANDGADAAIAFFRDLLLELRASCFLTGSRFVADLSRAPTVVAGTTAEWLRALGHDPARLGAARRGGDAG